MCEPLTLSAHETRLAIGCIRARGSAKVNTKKQSDGSRDHGLACGVNGSFSVPALLGVVKSSMMVIPASFS